MAMDTGRPSQKTQKSRKGKRAWRKNIDLDQIEQDIDDKNEQEIVLGVTNEPIFTVDRKGSEEGLTNDMKKERRLKSHEILHARSAVPPVIAHHKKKDHPKAKTKVKDVKGILERAGFTDKSTTSAQLERDGLLKSGEPTDLWGASSEPETPAAPVPARPTPVPAAVRKPAAPEPPIPGSVAVEVPSAGISYNPALEDWKATILEAHKKLEKEEEKRIQAEEERARIEAIIAETEYKLNEDGNDESDESEEENEDTADNDQKSTSLSVNPPVQLKRKTRTQRNRERRHKQWLYDLKQLKEKRRFMQSLIDQNKTKGQDDEVTPKEPRAPKRKLKAHSAYPVMEEPLAVKLSDELDDSLRRLKPEGSLLKDRMRSFQSRGLVEARVPVKKRKSRHKMVEKHSFRHFQ